MKSYDTESRKETHSTHPAQEETGSTPAAMPVDAINGDEQAVETLDAESPATLPEETSSAESNGVSEERVIGDDSTAVEVTDESVEVAEPVEEEQAAEKEKVLDGSSVADDEASPPLTARAGFRPPTRQQVVDLLPFLLVVLVGAVLRFWGLGDKPLHHDESLHAYYSLQFLHQLGDWTSCFNLPGSCYTYNPLLHGPFQFHAIALSYKISQLLGAPDSGVNTFTVRIPAALLGSLIVALPIFLRDYLGKLGALLACFLLAVSPSMVYFSRFAREDIYMACFTLLMVVSVARYLRSRKMRWLVLAAAALSLSYATKEATFLSVAVFGSFLGGLIAWELGLKWQVRAAVRPDTALARYLPRTGAPICLIIYAVIMAPIAKLALNWMETTANYITGNQAAADAFVAQLKDKTLSIIPLVGILLGIYVLSILVREMLGKLPMGGRHGLARYVDPKKQTVLDTILTMPWTHWFFALLAAWGIFLVLFTVLFTNIRGGIGDGIWQGLYYWLQQQQVARGGQPWYYYLMLIPLYEQIGLVFGIVGVVRSLMHPTRFRLFLVYWFVGNFFIYSWAAEKMPWLMIHITMPMMLLAAIGLEPAAVKVLAFAKQELGRRRERQSELALAPGGGILAVPPARPHIGLRSGVSAILVCLLALLLLLPTLQNMYEVTYVHSADGPHEMMVYVQTTTDVNVLMSRIDALDQQYDGGKHLLYIGLQGDATWPLVWYLRDYPNTCLNYVGGVCGTGVPPVVIAGGDDTQGAEAKYAPVTATSPGYAFHQYRMRTWWDEGYKPPPCIPTATDNCVGQSSWPGVGPALWLSYGDNPPPGATFDLGRTIGNIWQWWWQRKSFGSTDGSYNMVLFIRNDLGVSP